MNALLCFLVVAGVVGGSMAQQTQPPPNPCRTCEIIINIARFHFNNTVNDKAALQVQLLMECARLAQFEGQAAADHCTSVVNSQIDTIYNDMHTSKTPRQTCTDIGECPPGLPKILKRQKRQRPHDPCRTCQIIVNIARHHFNGSVTDKNALKQQLLLECQNLAFVEGQQAADACTNIVNTKIDQIYADMSTNKPAHQTCVDIGECQQGGSPAPQKRFRRQAHDPCRTCEIIIGIAKRHFNNMFNNQTALQAQLIYECNQLANHGFSASEVQNCITIINTNIAAIYNELVNNPNVDPHQVCKDLGECQTKMLKRQKRQTHDPCRTCEIIIGIAKRHFNNMFNNQDVLQVQLIYECNQLANHGFSASEVQNCITLINTNIAAIYNELVNNPNADPHQVCKDLGECQTKLLKRQKRQGNQYCRTCETIINVARHHFNNNITSQDALKTQLLVECQHLAQIEGQAAADHCKMIINNNIAKIFQDVSVTHLTARQTCIDIKECPQPGRRRRNA